jgi:BioD-like phosphotransacetylase family protein
LTKSAIYIASTDELSGKSVVTISLARIAKGLGKNVGYFKPIGVASAISAKGDVLDEDVETMKQLLRLENETSLICPFIFGKGEFLEEFVKVDASECADQIITSYRKASEDKDFMLIEGPSTLAVGSFIGCPVPKLAADLNARVLLIARSRDDYVVDEILQARDYCMKWGVSLLGVVLNRVPLSRMEKARNLIEFFLEKNGIRVLGMIPEDKMLSTLTVREIYEVIGGKVLAGKDGMDNIVETVLVGAMTPESALRYFRKAKNEIIITGGDRTDIIFAALEVGASGLILTGNLYPSVKIFPRADDLSVPIILVPYDTYTTLQQVQRIVGKIKPEDKKRIDHAQKLVKENIDWKEIIPNCSAAD